MTTARESKNLLGALQIRHSDGAIVGRRFVICPVHHVVTGVLVDRTSSATHCSPTWFAYHLFEPTTSIGLTFGQRIASPKAGLWRIDDPDVPRLLIDAVEPSILPRLRELAQIESYRSHIANHKLYGFMKRPLTRIIFDVAMGDLDAARAISRDVVAPLDVATFGRDEVFKDQLRRAKELCRRLDTDDRAGMAALLHEWEAISVKNLKLEKVWKKTPFPLERQAPP